MLSQAAPWGGRILYTRTSPSRARRGVWLVTSHRGGAGARPSFVVPAVLRRVRVPSGDDPGRDRRSPRDQPGPRRPRVEAAEDLRPRRGADGPRRGGPLPPEGVLPHSRWGGGRPGPSRPRPSEARPPCGRGPPAGSPRCRGDRVPEGPRDPGAGGDSDSPVRGPRGAPSPADEARARTAGGGALRGPGRGTRIPSSLARFPRSPGDSPRRGGGRGDRPRRPRGPRGPGPRVVPEGVRGRRRPHVRVRPPGLPPANRQAPA